MNKTLCFLFAFAGLVLNQLNSQSSSVGCGINHDPPSEPTTVREDCSFNSVDDFMSKHIEDIVPSGTEKLKIHTNVVLLQDLNGFGNFDLDDPLHMGWLNEIFSSMNNQLSNLSQQSCSCSIMPSHYSDVKIEFVPNFIEYRHVTLWDHTNDPTPEDHVNGSLASTDYLHLIRNELLAIPGFVEGFDVYITSHGPNISNYINNNPQNLPCWALSGCGLPEYDGHWYSDFPSSINLSEPAFWHAPDVFIGHLQTVDGHTGEDPLERLHYIGDGFLHEYGHLLNLSHRSCSNNIMNGGNWSSRTSLTGCQV